MLSMSVITYWVACTILFVILFWEEIPPEAFRMFFLCIGTRPTNILPEQATDFMKTNADELDEMEAFTKLLFKKKTKYSASMEDID